MGIVVLIRHGMTSYNKPGEERIRGSLDIPLLPEGEQEIKRLAPKLAGLDIPEVYTAQDQRSYDSAMVLINELSKYQEMPDIIEYLGLGAWHLGELEGHLVKEVLPQMLHYIKNENEAPEEGESYRTFRLRFLSTLQDLLADEDPVCPAFTHSHNLRLADAWVASGGKDINVVDRDMLVDQDYDDGPPGHMMLIAPTKEGTVKCDLKNIQDFLGKAEKGPFEVE